MHTDSATKFTQLLAVALQRWVSIAIFLGTVIALYWGLVCSYGRREGQPKETSLHYLNSLRWMCCLLLCSCVNVAKSLLAKVMSAHFYVESYFDKMQAALRQVRTSCHGWVCTYVCNVMACCPVVGSAWQGAAMQIAAACKRSSYHNFCFIVPGCAQEYILLALSQPPAMDFSDDDEESGSRTGTFMQAIPRLVRPPPGCRDC